MFEDAYKLSETPLDRLNIEIADLKQKADKLGAFIFNKNDGKDFKALPLGTRAFLIAQFYTMCAYLNLAALRQSCMEGNEECRPSGLSFEQILPMLREGFSIRRAGWNGKGKVKTKEIEREERAIAINGTSFNAGLLQKIAEAMNDIGLPYGVITYQAKNSQPMLIQLQEGIEVIMPCIGIEPCRELHLKQANEE